jgi:hypothetical protein
VPRHVFAALEANMTHMTAAYRTYVRHDRAVWITGASNIPGLVVECPDRETLYQVVDEAGSVLVWMNFFQKGRPADANLLHEVIVLEGDKVTERKTLEINLDRAMKIMGA